MSRAADYLKRACYPLETVISRNVIYFYIRSVILILLSDIIALDGVDPDAPVYQFHHCSTLAVCKQPQLLSLLHPRYNKIKGSACAKALFSSSGPYSENAAPPSYSQSHTLQAALQTETCNERQRSEKLRLALMWN